MWFDDFHDCPQIMPTNNISNERRVWDLAKNQHTRFLKPHLPFKQECNFLMLETNRMET